MFFSDGQERGRWGRVLPGWSGVSSKSREAKEIKEGGRSVTELS